MFDITANINQLNMFQYSWNDGEKYLFKANIAYAMRQYYADQNETLEFTSVSTAKQKI